MKRREPDSDGYLLALAIFEVMNRITATLIGVGLVLLTLPN